MGVWFSIEVLDGATAAGTWAELHGDALVWRAQEHGATDWSWHQHTWGVVFEVELPDDAAWEAFRASSRVAAALDAVPDPVTGLIVYKGRGGSSGSRQPRPRRPIIGAGAASLPLPELDDMTEDAFAAPRLLLTS